LFGWLKVRRRSLADKLHSTKTYRTVGEIKEIVRKFETCIIAPSEFSHQAHLTVALWYLSHFPFDEAAELMRDGLRRFIKQHNAAGYHETITVFWLKLVRRFLDETAADQTLIDAANELLQKFDDSKLLLQFYSHDVIHSETARVMWVEPDRKRI